VGQLCDLINVPESQVCVNMPQHANRKLARASGVTVAGEPIIETISDRPQQRQGQKLSVKSGE
jgi:hypothetical protein